MQKRQASGSQLGTQDEAHGEARRSEGVTFGTVVDEASPANYVTAPPRGGGIGTGDGGGFEVVSLPSTGPAWLSFRGNCLSRQSTGTCVPSPTSRLVERARGKGARGLHIADVSLPVLGSKLLAHSMCSAQLASSTPPHMELGETRTSYEANDDSPWTRQQLLKGQNGVVNAFAGVVVGGSPLDAIALPGLSWPLMKFAATELWYAMEVEPNGSGAAILSDLMAMMTPVADMKHAEPVDAHIARTTRDIGCMSPPATLQNGAPCIFFENLGGHTVAPLTVGEKQHAREAANCIVVVQSPITSRMSPTHDLHQARRRGWRQPTLGDALFRNRASSKVARAAAPPVRATTKNKRTSTTTATSDRVQTDVLLAIQPAHLNNILTRQKNHDYRKYRLRDGVERLWLYETRGTTQESEGAAAITHIATIPFDVRHTPGTVPEELFGIGNAEFNAGKKQSKYGYPIMELYRLVKPIPLAEMRTVWGMGGAPMGWCYVKKPMWQDRWGEEQGRDKRVSRVF
ncbi:PUA-like domain protein [Purpureocillium lilacinum]|uniref:PUA-like domain protein n=1 Tax=Purpureocillium lilacinum TaxID=33203 RepID=A0A2U3EI54_PURLI|nr:PUA-like domain protein [Purpureocillium lilacinum]